MANITEQLPKRPPIIVYLEERTFYGHLPGFPHERFEVCPGKPFSVDLSERLGETNEEWVRIKLNPPSLPIHTKSNKGIKSRRFNPDDSSLWVDKRSFAQVSSLRDLGVLEAVKLLSNCEVIHPIIVKKGWLGSKGCFAQLPKERFEVKIQDHSPGDRWVRLELPDKRVLWVNQDSFNKNSSLRWMGVERAVEFISDCSSPFILEEIDRGLQESGWPPLNREDFLKLSPEERRILFINLSKDIPPSLDHWRRSKLKDEQVFSIFLNRTKQGDQIIGRGTDNTAKFALWFYRDDSSETRIEKVVRGSTRTERAADRVRPKVFRKILELRKKEALRGIIPLLFASRWRHSKRAAEKKGEKDKFQAFSSFCRGGNLESRLDQFTDKQKPGIIFDILHGLKTLHESGIVHRDVTSENILLKRSPEGLRALISDFGASTRVGKEECPFGPLARAAPEIASADPRIRREVFLPSDIWPLGICIGRMFASAEQKKLYKEKAEELMESRTPFGRISKEYASWLREDLSDQRIWQLIEPMLREDPEERITIQQAIPLAEEVLGSDPYLETEQVEGKVDL